MREGAVPAAGLVYKINTLNRFLEIFQNSKKTLRGGKGDQLEIEISVTGTIVYSLRDEKNAGYGGNGGVGEERSLGKKNQRKKG